MPSICETKETFECNMYHAFRFYHVGLDWIEYAIYLCFGIIFNKTVVSIIIIFMYNNELLA